MFYGRTRINSYRNCTKTRTLSSCRLYGGYGKNRILYRNPRILYRTEKGSLRPHLLTILEETVRHNPTRGKKSSAAFTPLQKPEAALTAHFNQHSTWFSKLFGIQQLFFYTVFMYCCTPL
jgi:hypothetical protein